jgi:hypothetical protein
MAIIHRFDINFAWRDARPCCLPFQFGGATQSGRLTSHYNNQDAVALVNNSNWIVGIVSDGCSSSARQDSNNEVGARLIAALLAKRVSRVVHKRGAIALSNYLHKVELDICKALRTLSVTFAPREMREEFVESFLMATTIIFAVDKKDFVVAACGDGVLAVNGEIMDLDSASGEYLALRLLRGYSRRSSSILKVIKTGKTAGLNSLLIGSDGFIDLCAQFPRLMQSFLERTNHDSAEGGYNDAVTLDFRKDFWFQAEVERWAASQDAHDDRSFLLVRRINATKEDQQICSKLDTRI